MILCIENPKDFTYVLISWLEKTENTRSIYKCELYFYTQANEQSENEFNKQVHL